MRDRYICDRKYFADRRICCETEKSTVAASDAGDDSCRAAADIITVSAQEGGETTAGRTISTLEELEQFREEVNKGEDFEGKIIQLTADIDLSERYGAEKGIDGEDVSWTPIGKDYGNSFAGTFDGGGHEIKGLYINNTDDYQGLFGYNEGTIKNLSVSGTVAGGDDVGGIAGYNRGTIENVCNTGDISGSEDIGGIAGRNVGTIKNSYNTGNVSGSGEDEDIDIGGITGDNSGYDIIIENSYNTGEIRVFIASGSFCKGGITGENYGSIKNCYYLSGTAVSGVGDGDSGTGVEAKTAAEFTDQDNFADWNFDKVWDMDIWLGHPVLRDNRQQSVAGTEEDPYLIPDLPTLENFRDSVNAGNDYSDKYVILTEDIDLSGKYGAEKGTDGGDVSWTPIGNDEHSFAGTFDGGGHEIKGMYIDDSAADYQGLFGYNSGTIKNLGVSGTVTGGNYVGGIAGYNDETIENVCNTGKISGSGNTGGIAGENYGIIENVYNTGDISGSGDSICVGGVIGYNEGTIKNSYNTGNVSGSGEDIYIGGVAGSGYDSIIKNSYNTGKISTSGESGDVYMGGVAGINDGTIVITAGYYLEGIAGVGNGNTDGTEVKTADQFASGEVAYLLQSAQTAAGGGY